MNSSSAVDLRRFAAAQAQPSTLTVSDSGLIQWRCVACGRECAELDDHDLRCYIGKVKVATCKACVGDCACSAWCRREEQRVFLRRSRSVRRKAVGCPFLPVVVALVVNCIRCVWFISPPEKRQALTFVRRRRESSLGVPRRSKAQPSSRSNSSMPTDELKASRKRKLMSGFAAIC